MYFLPCITRGVKKAFFLGGTPVVSPHHRDDPAELVRGGGLWQVASTPLGQGYQRGGG